MMGDDSKPGFIAENPFCQISYQRIIDSFGIIAWDKWLRLIN